MSRIIVLLALIAIGQCALPRNERPQTGDDGALKKFLMKNNRLPYANETVTEDGQPNVRDWTTCEGCKLLVTELREILKNPQKVDDLKQLLGRVCEMRIMSHYKAECLNMVNNLITVLHEIEPILDNPTAVCQELQYCASGNGRVSISPAKHMALLLGLKAMEVMYPGRKNDVVCDECIFAMSEVKSLVQSASIQAELKQELHRICRMAGQYEQECGALVDQYFDLLIQELVQLLSDGRAVCADIGFCNSTTSTITSLRGSVPLTRVRPAESRMTGRVQLRRISVSPVTPKLETFLFTVQRLQTRQGINAQCLFCEAAFTEAIRVLSQEEVASMVTADLTNFVCAMVPESIKASCTDFMRIYSRAALQMIITQYTPAQLCSAMRVCKPEDERKIQQLSATEKSAAICEACQVLSQYLGFEFKQPDFQQEIVGTLKNGCTFLPGDYKNQCEDTLVSYVPTVLVYLADFLERNVVCATFKMCPGLEETTTASILN